MSELTPKQRRMLRSIRRMGIRATEHSLPPHIIRALHRTGLIERANTDGRVHLRLTAAGRAALGEG